MCWEVKGQSCACMKYWIYGNVNFHFQGHYRRAVVHEKLQNLEESLAAYMLCMQFGGNESVIQKATAAVETILIFHK